MALTVANYIASAGAGGKFVVLVDAKDAEDGVLALSDFTKDFQHADIVRRWERANKTSVAEAGYRVDGGGWWKIEGGLLILYGQSAAYGRFRPDWLRPKIQAGMVANETAVDVR